MVTGKFVAYYRVSTESQGRSGLGLEAQRKSVTDYLNGGSWDLIAEYTEVESGTNTNNPQLAAALAFCKKHKAVLVVAKLDRISRSLAEIANLLEGNKVKFICVDMPDAPREFIQMRGVWAEYEAALISRRTKDALAAAKARGKVLGWANPIRSKEACKAASARGVAVRGAKADKFAANVMPIIRDIQAKGITSLAGIAKALNEKGISTVRGGEWFAASVKNVLGRSRE